MNGQDYTMPCIYMITIATEGRRALLGRVEGRPDRTCDDADGPHMVLTVLGEGIRRMVELIPRYYPELRILAKQVMPDHLHFIVYVTEPMAVHIGKVVAGFKAGCNRLYRELAASAVADGTAEGAAHGLLWERGYHDRVLRGRNQLQAMIDYIHDNPRRLLLKRCSPFLRQTEVSIGGERVHAYGNTALLSRPVIRQVRCSRRMGDEDIRRCCERMVEEGRQGAVLVSPFISAGEKAVERAALSAGLPLIRLLDNGFPALFKPSGAAFDTCAAGRLLLLSPYDYRTEHTPITRETCNRLNALAQLIATDEG